MRMTITILAIATTLLAAGTVTELAAQTPSESAPDTVVMGGPPVGTVSFSHAEHQTMTECVACHHESRPEKPLTDPYQACDACHQTSPSPPVTTSLRDAFHDMRAQKGLCIDCHKEAGPDANAPIRCNTCHIKER